jgi:hypothetical protein
MVTKQQEVDELVRREYKHGWVTDIEQDTVPPGLDEDVIRLISAKKGEPDWLLEWRLKAFRHWQTMEEPHWLNGHYEPIDYQSQSYYSAPKSVKPLQSLDEVVLRAIDNDTCIYDPNCMVANRGADHGCLQLPETACQAWNWFISRWELFGSPDGRTVGYWNPQLDADPR